MTKNLLEDMTDYKEAYKDDEAIISLLSQIEQKLDAKAYKARINMLAEKSFDFENPKNPIFSSLNEPKTFIHGYDKALDVIALFVNIAYKSGFDLKDMDFLRERLLTTWSSAIDKDFKTYLDDLAANEDVDRLWRISSSFRKKDLVASIEDIESRIEDRKSMIALYASEEHVADRLKLEEQLVEANRRIEAFKTSKTVPDDFFMLSVFAGRPLDQLRHNAETIQSRIDNLGHDEIHARKGLEQMRARLDSLREELARLENRTVEVEF